MLTVKFCSDVTCLGLAVRRGVEFRYGDTFMIG